MTSICLGILARNEAARIGEVISDLAGQSLFDDRTIAFELHVVANGCTDDTAAVADRELLKLKALRPDVRVLVHDLAQGGKSHAWNHFIHTLVPASTNFVFMLDADIRVPESDALRLVLDGLRGSPSAVVAVDESVKDLALRRPRSLAERLIKAGTGTADDTRTAIAGALYCARYEELEKIWMPLGLPGEDGFLRAMLLTSSFAHEERLERLIKVSSARHIFESVNTVRGIFRHNVRLAVGTGMNILLFEHLREIRARGIDPAEHIRSMNLSDPDWINGLVSARLQKGARYPLHGSFLRRRWRLFRQLPVMGKIKRLPVFLMGLGFDAMIYPRANALMRNGRGAGFW